MEVLGCTKWFFNIRGNSSNFGCFSIKGLFSAAFVRHRIYKLIDVAYSRVFSACLNVGVLMGAYVML